MTAVKVLTSLMGAVCLALAALYAYAGQPRLTGPHAAFWRWVAAPCMAWCAAILLIAAGIL